MDVWHALPNCIALSAYKSSTYICLDITSKIQIHKRQTYAPILTYTHTHTHTHTHKHSPWHTQAPQSRGTEQKKFQKEKGFQGRFKGTYRGCVTDRSGELVPWSPVARLSLLCPMPNCWSRFMLCLLLLPVFEFLLPKRVSMKLVVGLTKPVPWRIQKLRIRKEK